MLECQWCGNDFIPKRTEATTCCSRDCGFAYLANVGAQRAQWRKAFTPWPEIKTTTCQLCERVIPAGRANYCGDECRKEVARRKATDLDKRKHQPRECECRVCGKGFTPEYGDKRRTLCSDICEATAQRATRRKRNRGLENHRRRARHYGVAYEPLKRRTVFERDGWKCGICGERISKSLRYPHTMSASLDHIVPLSQGGGHVLTNVQAAHFICNSYKSAGSAGEQLLLVG